MLFSRDWIGEYVDLPDDDALCDGLTAAGLAVEERTESGGDLLIDVDVTTNRPDAMCHLGMAREVAALSGSALRRPQVACEEAPERAAAVTSVEIEDADCHRYVARVVRGVRVGPSPDWLVRRLASIGQRSINNVVDVTNFVLWETGQPIHAFDIDTLAGRRIVVRAAAAGEKLTTLDGEERELDSGVLVIADAERAVALAGIMGGLDTEVTGATADVLVESAHFDRTRVRKGASRLGLKTDASHRFERGAEPRACRAAADRVCALLAEIAGGTPLAGAVEVDGPEIDTLEPPSGVLDAGRLAAFAGREYSNEEIERSLSSLGFGLEPEGDGRYRVQVPSWRLYDFIDRRSDGDVWPADLYEEVMRLAGFDSIPSALPALAGPDEGSSAEHRLRVQVREHLAGCGLAEAITFSFHDAASSATFPGLGAEAPPIALANPISERLAVMRRSLLPGLVESARFNLNRGAAAIRLFEVGRVVPGAREDEVDAVAAVVGGVAGTPWDRTRELDLFYLKGAVEGLAGRFGATLEAVPAELAGLMPGSSCRLEGEGGETVGYLGRLDDPDLPFALHLFELDTAALTAGRRRLEVEEPSRHPGIAVDLTLTHPVDVPWRDLAAAIREADPEDLVDYGLKDRYRGEGVPEGAVNTTIHFLYNASDRSLTQDEVNERHGRLSETLRRRFSAG